MSSSLLMFVPSSVLGFVFNQKDNMKQKTLTTFAVIVLLGGLSACSGTPEVLDPDGRAYAIIHLSFDS